MDKILENKKILITAGPVWVPIDRVRVMTNTFGGALGAIIAQKAYELGADVTLLMGPGRARLPEPTERFNIIKFKYYEEILSLVKEHVGAKKHEIMIHSAAVADYTPVETGAGKIKSGKDELVITLKPTIKIVDLIKEIDPSLFLVKFKLEVDLPEEKLIDIAYNSMLHSKADLIVANDFTTVSNNHKAFIIDPEKNIESFTEKEVIALNVLKTIAARV